MMPCCTADIFNIACADTFLTGRHTMAGRLNLPVNTVSVAPSLRRSKAGWDHLLESTENFSAADVLSSFRKKDKYASRISLPFMICPLRYFDFVVFVYYTMQT